MGKKAREYKSGDFIFAKVKGYPAWPARVQKPNGKKYFVYFYGTGETANLPPNMIFDYAENKDKFLTKTVKRRDFNDGVKQIEHDFANNVPLADIIGVPMDQAPADTSANDTINDSTANDTVDDTTVADTTVADDTVADESSANITAPASTEPAVEDSDEAGALVIDEGNKQQKGRKSKVEPKPAKESKDTPVKAKEPKTPRGKAKKEEVKKDEPKKDEPKEDEEEKKEDEIVSRSGRKIRPKRYIDEQTEDNATLPSPAPKKRRGASPSLDKEKDKVEPPKEKTVEKNNKHYNTVAQAELEDLKEPFKQDATEKDNILIAYLPTGQYVGIKLFQSRPATFKNESSRLQWDKQAASNAVTLKLQLERGQIKPESILAQLVMDLNLTDEEKAILDKERETEEKKSRVQFLKTEMKLIELDAKIKTCLCLEKADTELCLKLLDELMELEVKPLMLLKHPTCVETVKRMRAYVGNTPSWDLSENDALVFSKQAHRIRKRADTLYKNMKELFTTPDGLSFWEYFSERVIQFKKITSKLSADELLEMVHEPLEMSVPTSHTMKAAIDAANEEQQEKDEDDTANQKKKSAKPKKAVNNTPSKPGTKRHNSRKQQEDEEKDKEEKESNEEQTCDKPTKENEKSIETEDTTKEKEIKQKDSSEKDNKRKDINEKEVKGKDSNKKESKRKDSSERETKENDSEKETKGKDSEKETKGKDSEKETKGKDSEKEIKAKDSEKDGKGKDSKQKDTNEKESKGKNNKSKDSKEKESKQKDSDKDSIEEDTNKDKNSSKEKESSSKAKTSSKENDMEVDKDGETEISNDAQEKNIDIAKESASTKDSENEKGSDKGENKEKEKVKEKEKDKDIAEPRAKRSRETKKTEPPPPRSPAKRKSKF